jgi:hypothetical protein
LALIALLFAAMFWRGFDPAKAKSLVASLSHATKPPHIKT